METSLRHGGKEPGGLQRHGFAAGVRSRHDEDPRGREQAHVHRHHGPEALAGPRGLGVTQQQERVSGAGQFE
jgi:hypothetical protein